MLFLVPNTYALQIEKACLIGYRLLKIGILLKKNQQKTIIWENYFFLADWYMDRD